MLLNILTLLEVPRFRYDQLWLYVSRLELHVLKTFWVEQISSYRTHFPI